ncbi:MAG: T9SS type A sorting domain-containing protein [Bacteroidales bacterium]|nr:T9SS type A sorting domain-containing protein [Bacteroidales bacterium]
MKKTLFTALMVLAALTGISQSWNAITSNAPSGFQTSLISSSESNITIHLQVPGFYTYEVNTPRGASNLISMPKAVSTAEAGEPNLPIIAIPTIIGDQQHYAIRVVNEHHVDYPMEVAPSKGDFSRQIDPDDVPYTFGTAYSTDAFFPSEQVGLYDPYILRDFRGQNMVIHPFAYNPISKTLRVYYDLTVEMYSDRANGENTFNRKSSTIKLDPEFSAMYNSRFINYQAALNRYSPVNETGKLLIICHDAFMSAMEPYVNWKKQIGIPTTMVGTSVAGANSESLKNYIQTQYDNDNSIAHILLVGDNAQIQGYYAYNGGYSGRSDNWYGQVAGNDFYNDVIVGRFSAENTSHVTTQVNKVITYERDLNANDTWLTYGTGVATVAGNGGHYNEDDWQHIDNIKTDLLGYHYTEVYRDYQNVSGTSSSATTLSQHINNGVSIINYCNHGNETGWGVFSYNNSHVNALTNVNKWPIVWSVACLNGKYDHSQPCFGETWLRANNSNDVNQPTGAIGGMFSYISQPWVPPMYGQDEMVDVLVESYQNHIKRTLGGTSFDGNMKIIDQYGANNSAAMGTYMCWILFGDPTLTLRNDVPADMGISHAPALPIGATSFVVNATNGDGARATLTLNGEIMGSAVIANGTATIEFETPTQIAQATLTVFGYNKITYIGTVNIVSGGDEGPVEVNVTASSNIIAKGASATLNAQATGGNWYFTYSWSPSESLSQSNVQSPIATPTTTTTYTCNVVSGSHSSADSCTITVVCPPNNVTATATGNSIQLQWDAANPADSYKVYRNSVLIAQNLTETSYTDSNLNPGSYSYRIVTVYQGIESPKSNASAATVTAPLSVTANANPAVIPSGSSTTLTATVTGGSNLTYSWTPIAGLSNPHAATTMATPLTTTTYTITVSGNGETATAETTVQVITQPVGLTANLVPDADNIVTLTWEPVSQADYYNVYHNNTLAASNLTETQYTSTTLENGNHCFTVTAVFQGVESPASETACVEISTCIPPKNFQAFYYWNDDEFGTRLIWEKDASVNMSLNRYYIYRGTDPDHLEIIASQVNVPFNYHYEYADEYVLPGEYYYMIGANYGNDIECYSEILAVLVTGIGEESRGMEVYPNPTHGNITVNAAKDSEIRILNSLGQTIYCSIMKDERLSLDLAPFGNGLYMIMIQSEQGISVKKVIVE